MDNNNNFGQPPVQPSMQPPAQPQYPYPPQYPQPAPMPPKQPKQPMDPAKKKKIILIVSICSAAVILGIAAAIIIPILLRVDYSTAYHAAKELESKIDDIYHSYDCKYVVEYVESSYTSIEKYTEYINGCKEIFNSETDELIKKLEDTSGVKQNNEIKTQFGKFKNEYYALLPDGSESLSTKLDLWKARHDFWIAADDLTMSSSDAEYTTAANYLINSGSDVLKTYGEGWLERRLAINAAYRAYQSASYFDSNYGQLRADYNNKKNEYNDWLATNKPDIKTLAPLEFGDTSKMNTEYDKLYELIADTYEKNYNYGSNDCSEIFGEIYCD